MARQGVNQANQTYNSAKDFGKTQEGNAAGLSASLTPAYEAEANDPQGFGKQGLANIKTDIGQSVGGSTAGAVGEGNLTAARTRNAGGFGAALDDAAQKGGETNAADTLQADIADQSLKESQRQAGLAGENSLYNTDTSDVLGAYGAQNAAVNASAAQQKVGWQQQLGGQAISDYLGAITGQIGGW